MRKLASIQTIKSLSPIPLKGKTDEFCSNIELARILDWNVVVKKGDFQVEDLCVYFEIDSLLPDAPCFEFLKDSKGKIPKIKTRRFQGQISQGLALPTDILHSFIRTGEGSTTVTCTCTQLCDPGEDVTKLIGVEKWEEPETFHAITKNRKKKGKRPSFVPKTDETRVQVLGDVVRKYQGHVFYVTEKLDGSSFSAYYNRGKFGVCSRNLELKSPLVPLWRRFLNWLLRRKGMRKSDFMDAFWQVATELDLKRKMRKLGKNIVIQGEVIGPKIQGNKYKLDKYELFPFQVWNIDRGEYYKYNTMLNILDYLEIGVVPTLYDHYILDKDVDGLLEEAEGNSLLNPDIPREGIVLRGLEEVYDQEFGDRLHRSRLSFKAINREFELKYS